jgi:hypothetical protein
VDAVAVEQVGDGPCPTGQRHPGGKRAAPQPFIDLGVGVRHDVEHGPHQPVDLPRIDSFRAAGSGSVGPQYPPAQRAGKRHVDVGHHAVSAASIASGAQVTSELETQPAPESERRNRHPLTLERVGQRRGQQVDHGVDKIGGSVNHPDIKHATNIPTPADSVDGVALGPSLGLSRLPPG